MSKQLWWKLPHNHMISITAGFYLGNNTQVTYHPYLQRMETDQKERKLKAWKTFSPISQHTQEGREQSSLGPKYMLMGQWLPGCVRTCVHVRASAVIVTLACAHARSCCSGFLNLLMFCILARVLLTCTLASFITHQSCFICKLIGPF